MGIINEIKDTARKTSNTVVDAAQNIIDKPKTPKELANRVVHQIS